MNLRKDPALKAQPIEVQDSVRPTTPQQPMLLLNTSNTMQVGNVATHAIELAESLRYPAYSEPEPEPEPPATMFADVANTVVKLPETIRAVERTQRHMMEPVRRGRARRTNTV